MAEDQQLNLELEEVIIAMPSAPAKRIGEIVKILQEARLDFETVPSIDQLATGQVKVSQLRAIEIQDLLGRQPVQLNTENIRQILSKRVVMVSYKGENITPTDHPKILRFVSEPRPLKEVRKHLDLLAAHLHDAEANQLKLMLKDAVPEYQPYLT